MKSRAAVHRTSRSGGNSTLRSRLRGHQAASMNPAVDTGWRNRIRADWSGDAGAGRVTGSRGWMVVVMAYPTAGRYRPGCSFAEGETSVAADMRESLSTPEPTPIRWRNFEVEMKVAMLAPIAWRTPPRHYGPWEQVTSLLTEGLVGSGVEVTLFATLDSVTSAALDGICPRPYAEDPSLDGRVWEALHVSHALAHSGEFDLVHNQLDWLPLAFERHVRAPMVTTIHGFSGHRDPAGLSAGQILLCRHLELRPRCGPGLCRDHLPRDRRGCAAVSGTVG